MSKNFDEKLNKIKELHDKHPMVIDYEIDYIISKYDRKGKIDPKKLKIYLSVAFVILCILLGLVNINSNVGELGWITYYAALIFFVVTLVSALMSIIATGGEGDTNSWSDCWRAAA